MKYLVDTSIWSLAFRRQEIKHEKVANLLSELIDRKQVVLCGAVRQELLSGIKIQEQFRLLKSRLRYFEDQRTTTEDYELAAEFYNTCRSNGVQGSNTDFLLCAIAANHNLTLLSSDGDFQHFQKHLKFKLEFLDLAS
ncbi:MAG: PIN domain-containing protein [Ignavibacteriales bacterium]|nr:PIN domain-containing protein [Ignavibacteriales bacterium]